MSAENRMVVERLVEAFQRGASLPDEIDLDNPMVKSVLEKMSDSRRKFFEAMAKNRVARKINVAQARGMSKYWNEVRHAKENGKKVAWIPFNFSPRIFHALGIIPVCVEGLDSMLMMLEEGIEPYLDLAVERGLPDTLCSAQRGVVGLFEAGVIEPPDLLLNGALGGCDPNSKIFEYMAEKWDIPILFLDVPYYHDQRSHDYYAYEFKEVIHALMDMTGTKLDEDRLREVCELSNQAQELALEINDMKTNVPNPVPHAYNGGDTGMKIILDGTQDAVDFYQISRDLIAENLKNRVSAAKPKEKLRCLFIYTGYYFDGTFTYWLEEEMSVSLLSTVLSWFDHLPIIDTSSLNSMFYGLSTGMLNLPMTRQLKGSWNMPGNWMEDCLYYAERYKADCCVFTGHTACKQAWGAYRLVTDKLKEELGIPSTRLEGDGWDKRVTPMAVIKEQLEEFFSIVQENKR
jgi:benzoyl-CoA reductase/2-hydroxyglutaryl-CoA dehydratase subunit BcrC/BadD/HgdB